MTRLAFLGLGAMGAPMANRLIDAGHDVMLWNRTRAKAEPFLGRATIAASPAEAARDVAAVFTSLATPEALSKVVFGADGVAAGVGRGVLIDMSTVAPDYALTIARGLPSGVEFMDAAVLGGVANAANGTLRIFVGASPVNFARWKPVLSALGTPMLMGPAGAGAAMKLVAQERGWGGRDVGPPRQRTM